MHSISYSLLIHMLCGLSVCRVSTNKPSNRWEVDQSGEWAILGDVSGRSKSTWSMWHGPARMDELT